MPQRQEYILINIYEDPLYISASVDNIGFPARNQIGPSGLKSRSEFGPVLYKDLCWTGTVSTAFLEIWNLDPLARLATKSGKQTVLYDSYITTSDD